MWVINQITAIIMNFLHRIIIMQLNHLGFSATEATTYTSLHFTSLQMEKEMNRWRCLRCWVSRFLNVNAFSAFHQAGREGINAPHPQPFLFHSIPPPNLGIHLWDVKFKINVKKKYGIREDVINNSVKTVKIPVIRIKFVIFPPPKSEEVDA